MRLFKSTAFFLLPFFLLADSLEDFNSLKNRIQQSLVQMDNYLLTVDSELGDSFDQFSQLTYPSTSEYAQGYNQALQDVSRSVMSDVRNAQQVCSSIHSEITSTQALVSNLEFGSSTNIDYTAILARMTNQLERIADLQDLTDDHVMTNTLVCSAAVNVCQDTLDAILTAILDMSGSSGGSSSDSDDLDEIISLLRDCRSYLNTLDGNVSSLVSFFTSQNGVFRSYLSLVEERLKTPDVNLAADLSRMWEYTLLQMTNIVYHPERYELDQQVGTVLNHVGENDIRLSNEGVIQLQNLAINQRQYLCSVEALRALQASTNRNDVGWITNYLATIQQGLYQSFNFENRHPLTYNPFGSNRSYVTNFLQHPASANYQKYRTYYTNYFDRLEIALYHIGGLFAVDNISDTQLAKNLLDAENFDRRSEYMTNNVNLAVGAVGAVSNNITSVVSAFRGLVDSFDLRSLSAADTEITLIPSYEMGGIQIDHVHFTTNQFSSFVDFARIAFTCIYYLVFSVVFFHLFMLAIRIFTRSVIFVASTVSKLLS